MEVRHSKQEKQELELQSTYFADMHLKLGEPLIVQPLGVAGSEAFTVSFIGAYGQMSFITSLPNVGGKGIWVVPGSRFSFRVIHGRYIFAFSSRSLRAHSRPYPYVHFAIPESVNFRQIRRSHRLETRLPVQLCRADASQTLAIMRDISEHGAKLELTGFLGEVGEEVTLTIPILLPDMLKSLPISATICNNSDVDRAMSAGRFHYGVSFSPLSPEQGTLLQRFIEHLMVEQLA